MSFDFCVLPAIEHLVKLCDPFSLLALRQTCSVCIATCRSNMNSTWQSYCLSQTCGVHTFHFKSLPSPLWILCFMRPIGPWHKAQRGVRTQKQTSVLFGYSPSPLRYNRGLQLNNYSVPTPKTSLETMLGKSWCLNVGKGEISNKQTLKLYKNLRFANSQLTSDFRCSVEIVENV